MSRFFYRELRSVALGDMLGSGLGRKVYVCKLNSSYVVKVEEGSCSFQNVEEWQAWYWVNHLPDMARWAGVSVLDAYQPQYDGLRPTVMAIFRAMWAARND